MKSKAQAFQIDRIRAVLLLADVVAESGEVEKSLSVQNGCALGTTSSINEGSKEGFTKCWILREGLDEDAKRETEDGEVGAFQSPLNVLRGCT